MICFPNAKINIGLQICSKRADGYHNLQTIFYPISIHDAMECIVDEHSKNKINIHVSGKIIEGNHENNLCYKAYGLLQKKMGDLPGIDVYLLKNIPMGAGLGGGSANGAFMLKMINEQFQLGLENKELAEISLELGSDCPFFIDNQPSYATGRGEIIEPVHLDLSKDYKILLINPGVHINTGWAFSQLTLKTQFPDLRTCITHSIEEWNGLIENDFEFAVTKAFPELAAVKKQLYESGALFASMSGSGSTFYGIFEKSAQPTLDFPESFLCKWA